MLNFKEDVAKIGGWLTETEGKFFYKIAKNISKESLIIEIGSWKGRSTICLGQGAKDGSGATIYAIDPHTGSSEQRKCYGKVDTYQEFLDNIRKAQVDQYIIPIKDASEHVAKKFNKQVNFIFVDGAHEYKFVSLDYQLWFPKLINGGFIAFHDCWHQIGIHFLIVKILLTSNKVRKPRLVDTMTVMEKVASNTVLERFGNILFIFYLFFFGWIGLIKMNYFGGKPKDQKH